MNYKLDDLTELAKRLTKLGPGAQRNLILIAGLPGVGKTTLARELTGRTQAVHFDIDSVKKMVVPQDKVSKEIDPPEYRHKYYLETIHRLPDLFAKDHNHTVVIDETFHLRGFRDMWTKAAKSLNIRLLWVEVVCPEEIVKERLRLGRDRENHILGDKAYPMYLLFKKMFEPMSEPREIVDNNRELVPQIQRIVKKVGDQ